MATWRVDSLNADASVSLQLDLVILSAGPFSLASSIETSDAPDTVSSNNSVTIGITPIGGSIDKLMSPQERTSSIAAIKAAMANLPGIDTAADNRALAQFIAARPEFVDAGTSDWGFTVWGQWRDGVQYLIVSNRSPGGQPITPRSAMQASAASVSLRSPEDGKPSNLPKSNQYRLLSASVGPGWLDIRPALRNYLANTGYQEIQADATVQSLRTVGGDGAFYFDSHGGSSKGFYALWTANVRTDANDELFKEDLAAGRLTFMTACYDASVPDFCKSASAHPERFQEHYAITSQFILKSWGYFSDNSMVYIDGCNFDTSLSGAFIEALINRHASVIFGWNGDVFDDDAAKTAQYIFDRLTGANDFEPQKSTTGFNQRPFDWVDVLADCFGHTTHCKSGPAHLTATEGIPLITTQSIPGCSTAGICDATFGLLAPSIRRMWVYESPNLSIFPIDLLFIAGLFGVDPGSAARGVSIGGTDAPVMVWAPSMIVVNLPHTGSGAAGDVVVRNGNRLSNTAQLTEWTVPFTFTLNDVQSLAEKVTINAHFRADIRKTVEIIGTPPVEPAAELPTLPSGFPLFLPPDVSWNTLLDDTGGQNTCTGSATITANGQTSTERWSGTKTISYKNDGHRPGAAHSYVQVKDSTTIVLTLEDWSGTCVSDIDGSPGTALGLWPGEVSPANDSSLNGNAAFFLDSTGNITAAQYSNTTHSHSALGGGLSSVKANWTWPATAPTRGAPDPNSPR